jgi:hypothetical protein
MTFQMHVIIGPYGTATTSAGGGTYTGFTNSTYELYLAREGQSSVLLHRQTGIVLQSDSPDHKFGKVWLLPYNTSKDASEVHEESSTWYDELIISRSRIPDPSPGSIAATPVPSVDKYKVYFGDITVGNYKDEVITLSNRGNAGLLVGQIAQANPLDIPFSIQEDNCSGTTLAPGASCTVTARYAPTPLGKAADSFDIPTNGTPSTLTIGVYSGSKSFPWTLFIPACTGAQPGN